MKCQNCNLETNERIHIKIRNKLKKVCFSCVRSKFWRLLREGGYWRRYFGKPEYNDGGNKK